MDPFIGEVRMFGWNWAPKGWALCDGTTMAVQQNQALYALLSQTYGGNGSTLFKLPDLRGRTPIHTGVTLDNISYPMGQAAGAEAVTLTDATIPPHNHLVNAISLTAGNVSGPKSSLPAQVGQSGGSAQPIYSPVNSAPLVVLSTNSISPTGDSQPHPNMQPYLVGNFCIATVGIYPSRA